MKTSLVIPDALYRAVKRRAAERGETISGVVADCLRRGLETDPPRGEQPALPAFEMGRARVDVADRDRVYRLLDADRRPARRVADDE